MGADEDGTLASLKAHREAVTPIVQAHGGRIVGSAGDGLLLEFPSVTEAVACATKVQPMMAERNDGVPDDRKMLYRIGINLGDVMIDGDDVYGDGVNIAARLEALAEPGGVCISQTVLEHVQDRIEVSFQDLGEVEVKNIARPIRVWRWITDAVPEATVADTAEGAGEPLPLPDKPSIAVLPFDNMSGDPEQEFFADGIAEDVITALSCFRSLFVIARNSSFSYKGTSPDIRTVSRDLGVRYVVEGSVRKADGRVRITAQLIDAVSGNHLWADRFDGALDDVFDLQDQITEQIVVAVAPEIEAHEIERVRRKPPESLSAWETYQKGVGHALRGANETDLTEAIRLFRAATELDPGFAMAHANLSWSLFISVTNDHVEDREGTIASARAAAEKAVSLDRNEAWAHVALGRSHTVAGEVEMAINDLQTAITLNPNHVWGHYELGFAYHIGAGQPEQALPHFDTALRLSPRNPGRWAILMLKGTVLRALGRHDEAVACCRQACQFPNTGFFPYLHLANALAEAGQKSEAQAAVDKAIELHPRLSISFYRDKIVAMHERTAKSFLDSMRKAGFPE
jgi:adenylate cyclase